MVGPEAVHQAAVRDASSDTSKTASVQGITVITIQAMCKIERISAIARLLRLQPLWDKRRQLYKTYQMSSAFALIGPVNMKHRRSW